MQNNNTDTLTLSVLGSTINLNAGSTSESQAEIPITETPDNQVDLELDDEDETEEYESDEDSSEEDLQSSQGKDGFLDIKTLYKRTPQVEIRRIDKTLEQLSNTMYKYILDAKALWDTEIGSFIESTDCLILDKLTPNDHREFIDFMCEQRTFRLMQTAHKRLSIRRAFLESNN